MQQKKLQKEAIWQQYLLKQRLVLLNELAQLNQKSIEPSPLRPQTTIAIEKVKTAANEAHARVKIMLIRNLRDEAFRLH